MYLVAYAMVHARFVSRERDVGSRQFATGALVLLEGAERVVVNATSGGRVGVAEQGVVCELFMHSRT